MDDNYMMSAPSTPSGPMSQPPAASPSVNEPVQPCPDKAGDEPEDDDPKTVKIRVTLFFDGTGNNRANVKQREEEMRAEAAKPKPADDDGILWMLPGAAEAIIAQAIAGWVERKVDATWYASYGAGYSNIAKLESAKLSSPGPGVQEHPPIYIEGIGTTDHASDSITAGQGLGMGNTGIWAKVEQAIEKAVTEVMSRASGRRIIEVHLDTLGFSRGAAAARLCLWCAKEDPGKTMQKRLQQIEPNKQPVGPLRVKFVGLYDTVASHGVGHANDTEDLHLRAVTLVEEHVVQLAAADEHRVNFRLTDIKSVCDKGKGTEIFLPGAHSDVGGGYAASENELDYLAYELDPELMQWIPQEVVDAVARERSRLIASGWYEEGDFDKQAARNTLVVNRRNIPNTYANIPLHIMANFARQYGVHIDSTLEDSNPVPSDPDMQQARSVINAYVGKCKAGRKSSQDDWLGPKPSGWLPHLRHRFLHFSASHNYVNTPQWSDDDLLHGRRERIIQPG